MNRLSRVVLLVLCSQLMLAGCSTSSDAPLDKQVNVGGHKLHIYCVGKGSPAVIIETGSGETYESWLPLIGKLAQETRVCATDRAGYGRSEPGPLPRDSVREADELRVLLRNAGIQGPVVLVGHSLGATNATVFAGRYPSLAAGAVLIDPPPLGWIAGGAYPELRALYEQQAAALESQGEVLSRSPDPQAKAEANFYAMLASEMKELMDSSARQVGAITSFGDMPLIVIASTQPNPQFGASAEEFQRFWIAQSEKLAAKSTRGALIRAEGSSHHVHLDAPQLVIEAVREVIGQFRQVQPAKKVLAK